MAHAPGTQFRIGMLDADDEDEAHSETGRFRPTPTMVCTICGHHGPARLHMSGSRPCEVALWCLALLPGLIYRLWRVATKRRVCAGCGAEHLVAPDSPVGRRLRAAHATD